MHLVRTNQFEITIATQLSNIFCCPMVSETLSALIVLGVHVSLFEQIECLYSRGWGKRPRGVDI